MHNDAAIEYQKLKEQETVLEELRKELETDIVKYESAGQNMEKLAETQMMQQDDAFQKLLEPAEADNQERTTESSVYDAEIARIEEEETKNQQEEKKYQSYKEEEIVNRNDEIISLYKKGRSILEISKMLSMGQGEVKFVIDLYNAR